MNTQCVWASGVDFDHAMVLVESGRARLIPYWDDRIWHYWRQLEWDQRPASECNHQPPEVQAYAITPADVRRLGVWLDRPANCVLFVFPDVQWAAVASDTRLVADDSASDFVPPGVGRLT
jgi:hypothetical protein